MNVRGWAVRLGALLPAPLLFVAAGVGAPRAAEAAPDFVPKSEAYIRGADAETSCGTCHAAPSEELIRLKKNEYVLLREYRFWKHHDLHRRAYDVLSTPLGQQMSRAMYGGDEMAATKAAACLACHSTDTVPVGSLASKTTEQFSGELGVNCQGCHGPANEWATPHWQDKWRSLSGAEKQTKFGLVHLREPSVRAAQCVKCHVGNAAEGKCVTHEMYAAGHPPLPAFELATFSRDEPRHWRQPSKVPVIAELAKKDPAAALARYGYRAGEVESARLVAEGAIASLKQSAKLVQFAEDPAKPDESLDFTHFNCSACHHELRLPSGRQKAGYPGVPGRPVPRTWPVWLVRVVLDHAAAAKLPDAARLGAEFERNFAAFRAGFNSRPFGDRAKVVAAADALAATCDELTALIGRQTYTDESARDLMARIAARGAEPPAGREFLDADGAYQLARAFAAIYTDLAGTPYVKAVTPSGPPAFGELPNDPDGLSASLKRLDAVTPLAVRTRYENGVPVGEGEKSDAPLIQSGLTERQKAYYAYDAEEFRAAFEEIRAKLKAAEGRKTAAR